MLHDGTLAIEFDQLVDGTLFRADGVLQIHLALPPQPGFPANRRGGQADYHEGNAVGGLLQPALHLESLPLLFQFSSTGVALVTATEMPALGMAARAGLIASIGLFGVRAARRARPSRAACGDPRPQ